MTGSWLRRSGGQNPSPGRRIVAGFILVVLALVAPVVPAQAGPGNPSGSSEAAEVRPATLRIAEDENRLIVFVNKSRADLCTPERIIFENAFQEWVNSGQETDPPIEPAASNEGVKPVRFTQRVAGQLMIGTVNGPNLPVEVWHLEDSVDGIDCTATDGPGAGLFATGAMTWRGHNVNGPRLTVSDVSVDGKIRATDGQRYHYLVRYQFRQFGNADGVITPTIRLTPTR